MNKRTISLNKENYLFLLKLISDVLESEKGNLDVSYYTNESEEMPDWRKEQYEKAVKSVPILEKLLDAILFGNDEE